MYQIATEPQHRREILAGGLKDYIMNGNLAYRLQDVTILMLS